MWIILRKEGDREIVRRKEVAGVEKENEGAKLRKEEIHLTCI